MSRHEEHAGRQLRYLIDAATPYRNGQQTLTQRASHRRMRPGNAPWALLTVLACAAFAAFAR